MAIFRARGEALTVRGESGEFVIEPTRFNLGLSQIEMVDWHLAHLYCEEKTYRADVDALLDARNACAFVATYTS